MYPITQLGSVIYEERLADAERQRPVQRLLAQRRAERRAERAERRMRRVERKIRRLRTQAGT